jgi:hypothetical protein
LIVRLFLLCAALARSPQETGLAIEAEAYETCEPAGVVRSHDLPWASGRTALIRFPQVKRVRWSFELAGSGAHDIWARYAARSSCELRWGLDGVEPVRRTSLEATGAFEGRGSWRWAVLGPVELAEGPHRLVLTGAPIRLDCLWIARAGSPAPTWPAEPPATELTPELVAKLAATPPRAAAVSLGSPALPDWYEEARVGLHTRLSTPWVDRPIFEAAEHAVATLGVQTLVRHVKSFAGECFWPSSVGAVADWVASKDEDPVAAMARRAHEEGLRLVAYYRHQEDRPLAREHPDWVCVDALGQVIRQSGEPRLCFHSPFADATRERLLELARRGVDGLYLDESHQPIEGCWCAWTRAAFERETGLPLPAAARVEDPLYRRFLSFCEDSLARTLEGWHRSLKAVAPGLVMLVSHHGQAHLLDPWPTARLGLVADAIKTELRSGLSPEGDARLGADPDQGPVRRDAQLTLAWVMARDAAQGRPAHVWVNGLEDAGRWRAATAAIVATGCVANLDHPEATLPDPGRFTAAIELGHALAAPLLRSRPAGEVALHLPEWARNALLADPADAWSETMGPMLQAWQALLDAHAPVSLLGDDLLEAGVPPGTHVLHLPAPELLEPAQRAAVERFQAAGGVVVEDDVPRLLEAVARLPVPAVLEAPPRVQAFWFRAGDGSWRVALTNAVGWILDRKGEAPASVTDARLILDGEGWQVRDAADEALEGVRTDRGLEVALPAFQEGASIRIEHDR